MKRYIVVRYNLHLLIVNQRRRGRQNDGDKKIDLSARCGSRSCENNPVVLKCSEGDFQRLSAIMADREIKKKIL